MTMTKNFSPVKIIHQMLNLHPTDTLFMLAHHLSTDLFLSVQIQCIQHSAKKQWLVCYCPNLMLSFCGHSPQALVCPEHTSPSHSVCSQESTCKFKVSFQTVPTINAVKAKAGMKRICLKSNCNNCSLFVITLLFTPTSFAPVVP